MKIFHQFTVILFLDTLAESIERFVFPVPFRPIWQIRESFPTLRAWFVPFRRIWQLTAYLEAYLKQMDDLCGVRNGLHGFGFLMSSGGFLGRFWFRK